ncbi:unnamed protein product [Phytophthora lilii]|uniref:Unnamed protein product n=1 Tax=Phytophthora lilii TaxID=2077276 RepID=A0A9W6TUB9_9STRA|nr:unnamed protein product [Phytophthora lilii]
MNISNFLSSPSETPRLRCGAQQNGGTRTALGPAEAYSMFSAKPPKHPTSKSSYHNNSTFAMIPDKERKRSYRLSATQKQSRREKEFFESRVLNLTLDINQLRQELVHLLSCRDLKVTRMLLDRERMEHAMQDAADAVLFGSSEGAQSCARRGESCNFSGMLMDQSGFTPFEGVYEFIVQLDTPATNRRARFFATTQILSFVEEDMGADSAADAELRRICGGSGGCVMEAVGDLKGRFTLKVVASMFPHVQEILLDRFVGLSIRCPARLLLYFNSQCELVRQIAQIDIPSVLSAVQLAQPQEFAVIMGRKAMPYEVRV